MDITPFVESFRRDLVTAAEAGSAEVREAAERLVLALGPAAQLTLMDALAQAADEISAELDGVSIDVRLRGREPEFVVTHTAAAPDPEPVPGSETAEPDIDDEGPSARITLRLPESLKTRAEESAASESVSLNTWLVNAVRMAASPGLHLSFGRGFPGAPPPPPAPPFPQRGKRIQGWVR